MQIHEGVLHLLAAVLSVANSVCRYSLKCPILPLGNYEAATGFATAAGAIPLFACLRAIFIARCFMYSLSNTPSHSDPCSPVSHNSF